MSSQDADGDDEAAASLELVRGRSASSESDGDDDDKKRHPSLDFNGTDGLEDIGSEERGRCGMQWVGGRRRSHYHYLGPSSPAYSHQSRSQASGGQESGHEEGRGNARRPVERCDSLGSRSDGHDRDLGMMNSSPASSSPPDDTSELLSEPEHGPERHRASTALHLTSSKGPAVSPALLCDWPEGGSMAENGEENENEDKSKQEIESENGVPDLNGYRSQGESSLAPVCCGKEGVKKNPKEGDIFEEEKRGGSGLTVGDETMKLEKGKSAMRGEEKKDREDKGPPSGMGKATSVHTFITIREGAASPKPPPETTNALGGGNGLYDWKIGNELCSRCRISKEGACWDHGGNKEMGGVY